MSIRVPIGSGTLKGVTHFPNVAKLTTDPDDPANPMLAFTLEQMLAYIWRVKTWHLTGTASAHYEPEFGTPSTVTMTIDAKYLNSSLASFELPTTEGGIIAFAAPPLNPLLSFLARQEESSFSTDSAHATTQLDRLFNLVVYDDDKNLFFPFPVAMHAGSGAATGTHWYSGPGEGGDLAVPHTITFEAAVTINFGAIAATISAASFAMKAGIPIDSGGLFIAAPTSASCNISMTAQDFWAYKNLSGNPVYNEITGERINDPFS